MEILLNEVKQAPSRDAGRGFRLCSFLKSGRFASPCSASHATAGEDIETVFDRPRTLSDLADEQRVFLASVSQPLVDIDLPSEE